MLVLLIEDDLDLGAALHRAHGRRSWLPVAEAHGRRAAPPGGRRRRGRAAGPGPARRQRPGPAAALQPRLGAYMRRLQALGTGDYALGWQGGGTPGQPLLVHSGGMPGFSSLVALRRDGEGGVFAFSNTQANNPADPDWVLDRLNSTLSAVLLGH